MILICRHARMPSSAGLPMHGKPLIGVHFNGRPVSGDTADRYLDAILEAWSPSETGAQAVADVLLGDYNPGGKLPVSVAYHAGTDPGLLQPSLRISMASAERASDLSTMWIFPTRPGISSDTGCPTHAFEYSDLSIYPKQEIRRGWIEIRISCSGDEYRRAAPVTRLCSCI